MTYEQNVRAILESNFAGFKDEIIDIACERICELTNPYDRVLEIIDRSIEYAKELDESFGDTAKGMLVASSGIRKAVLVLKEGK